MTCENCGADLTPLTGDGVDVGDVCLECNTVYLGYGWNAE